MTWLTNLTMIILGIMLLTFSCTQNKKQRVLSIFFDGVEIPDTTSAGKTPGTGGNAENDSQSQLVRSTPTYYYHAIYQQKECAACHDSENANRLIEELPDLCYQCHTDFSKEYEYLHVPVAMGECGECHHPHLAKNEKLLISQIQPLCFSCHDPDDLLETETHSEIGDASCSDCHNPHGGEDEYLFN